jgi:uncharacterized protein (TIGR03435 family)
MNSIADHLWQSTLFAGVAWLLTLALRKNRARLRHGLWLVASVKFLIPFSLFVALGSLVPRSAVPLTVQSNIVVAIDQVSRPLATLTVAAIVPPTPSPLPAILLSVWACGFIGIACAWSVRWRRIRRVVRAGSPLQLELPIKARSSPTLLEPGVFGIFRPVLLLPEGVFDRLTPAQLQAVMAHELCHARRRDNLIATIHMFVETVFWFHPLVWWIGKRMVEERERACDEDVLRELAEPRSYAEGILNICKLYVESPLRCVSGVTGPNLKKRIEAIMTNRIGFRLNFARKAALAATATVALAMPILLGVMHAQSAAPAPKFEVASIKPNNGVSRRMGFDTGPGRFVARNVTLRMLIQSAYRIQDFQITGGPAWMNSDRYDIEAKAGDHANGNDINGPMLQRLLEDRFQLSVRREIRDLPVYLLSAAKSGSKLQSEHCVAQNSNTSPPAAQMRSDTCGFTVMDNNMIKAKQIDMARFIPLLTVWVKRTVIDRTGVMGTFDVDLKWNPDETAADGATAPSSDSPSIFTALQEQLGLKLDSAKGPVEVLVIDHVERPSEN